MYHAHFATKFNLVDTYVLYTKFISIINQLFLYWQYTESESLETVFQNILVEILFYTKTFQIKFK